ncbi:hypothetical protein FB45DRAFT_1057185 [Roridomyces roridus]|uniref:Acetyl-CoA synthetase-like protein n=1 Tax=Roridomyces roridus TaxID=1738132 RepID=A0AAD7C082_9AGAR|nr:hypothetical protein FB45DRAFT_1057185 [Roridomyces roridus]
MSLPLPPHTQALDCATFTAPPLDAGLTLPQIYDWHFEHTPNHRLFVHPCADGSTRTIYWREAVQAIYVGAALLRSRFGWSSGMAETPVVAILASSDIIPYFTLIVSCMRANYIPFPISPRNSPAAIAHLIEKVGVSHLLIGHEPAMSALAKQAISILTTKNNQPYSIPDISLVPLFDKLFLPSSANAITPDALPYENKGPEATSVILHSSGSTAFPKPIYWTNYGVIQGCLNPWFGERDLTDQILSVQGLPMYHGLGVMQTWWAASCGLVLSVFEPKPIPTVATPDLWFEAARNTASDVILTVPALIEAWSRNPEYVQWLSTRAGVVFSGGPLNKAVGDHLVSQGVNIFTLYGATECGIMSLVLPARVGKDWQYLSFPASINAEMVPFGDGLFELVIMPHVWHSPCVVNTQIRGINAYSTSDLFTAHPTKPGCWRIFGRADDQIMHSTGEKTNPVPLEIILARDPHVQSCVMFGRGRFQAGVLIHPKPEFEFDPSDAVRLAEFRNQLWPTIVKMNEIAPQHSRLFKEMILVSKPSKPFTYTAKMTVRRQAVIADYEEEFDQLYKLIEESAALNIPQLQAWDAASILDFVRNAVHSLMKADVGDDEDIFQHGCDSLQATWLRNCILASLRESAQLDTRGNARNFVYDYPTVSSLARYIFLVVSGEEAPSTARPPAMQALLAKYSQNFPSHSGTKPATQRVVLVTGTTGELGCHLLSLLLADEPVSRVYALNRQHPDLRERQARAFVERGLDVGRLDSPKLVLLAGNAAVPSFGLPDEIYKEIQDTVTHIIHNAWPVDFNLALPSFEPNIKGLRALVDLSLRSPFIEPPKILYTSSIGIFQHPQTRMPLKEISVDAEVATGIGYVESKWVSESILLRAAEATPLKPLIVRVGQLSGGANGAWNIGEWVPAVVQSAKFIGCIPHDRRDVSWIAVDIAAAAIVEFLGAPSTATFTHLVNPKPVPWSTLASMIARNLDVPLVPYEKWLSRVEAAGEALEGFRAPRLLSTFRAFQNSEGQTDAFGFAKLDIANALDASETLQSGKCQLGEKDVESWLGYWRSAGLL